MSQPRSRRVPPEVCSLESRNLMSTGLVPSWIGQDDQDQVGKSHLPAPSGIQDIHVKLDGLPPGHEVVGGEVRGFGGGRWNVTGGPGTWLARIVRAPASPRADLFFEPYQADNGRPYTIELRLDDGTLLNAEVQGGPVNPSLIPTAKHMRGQWGGQDTRDLVGLGPSVGPDGRGDARLTLANLMPDQEITSVLLSGPPDLAWRSGLNPQGDNNAELIRSSTDPARAEFVFQPDRNLAGLPLQVQVTYANGGIDTITITTGRTDPNATLTPPPQPKIELGRIQPSWLGQSNSTGLGNVFTLGDARIRVDGLSAGRRVVEAHLSDSLMGLWSFVSSSTPRDPLARPMAVQSVSGRPSQIDLVFTPDRNFASEPLTLRLVYEDGTQSVAQFQGGVADPSLAWPAPNTTEVVARPGDDLQALVDVHGSVLLQPGVYELNAPLVLHHAVTLKATAPGVTLRYQQAEGSAPWTAAIKIHASNTSLEGFAVRFAGPVRWADGIDGGGAVIGASDNLDPFIADPKYDILLKGLDLESPPASTAWEEAAHLVRFHKAYSGRIENNTLRGGYVWIENGPWIISHNHYTGTPVNTFATTVFTARFANDLVLSDNRAEVLGPAGKTWRFLVLSQGGYGIEVARNTVVNIGPMDGDTVEHPNASETILTEAYRLRFEGRPMAVSNDLRLLTIPTPQGLPARVGDVVSILAGPHAGQYRRIAQAISPTVYLLDSPLPGPLGDAAISIVTGFVDLTLDGNTIDNRASRQTQNIQLAGNLFGTRVVNNTLLGGERSLLILASATEEPVSWGWSHAPFLGGVISGNTFADATRGAQLAVERGAWIKSNRGRVYFTAALEDNRFVLSEEFLERMAAQTDPTDKPQAPQALTLGDIRSIDTSEIQITERGNRLVGVPADLADDVLWVPSARINGLPQRDASLDWPVEQSIPLLDLTLANDSGGDSADRLTNDPRVRITAALSDEWARQNLVYWTDSAEQPRPVSGTIFTPEGLSEGLNVMHLAAVDSSGRLMPESVRQLTFWLDTQSPAIPSITPKAASTPVFDVSAESSDFLALVRDGQEIARRHGPGELADPFPLADRSVSYSVIVTDRAGNGAQSPKVAMQAIGSQPPTPGEVSPGSGPVAIWRGQTGKDLVGLNSNGRPDRIQDVQFTVLNLPSGRTIAAVDILGVGGGRWRSNGPRGTRRALVVQPRGSTAAEIFFQPERAETGRSFLVRLRLDNGEWVTVELRGGAANPGLRAASVTRPTRPVAAASRAHR